MAPKKNPLKLNGLQLRTLALLQELARYPDAATKDEASGEVRIDALPHIHGNHVHIGRFVVSSRDASGLSNEAVWVALDRKKLARSDYPASLTLLPDGLTYDTGLTEQFLGHSDH
jgi:hypothetical protein